MAEFSAQVKEWLASGAGATGAIKVRIATTNSLASAAMLAASSCA